MKEKIAQYWQSLLPEKPLFIQEMEQLAKEEHVPIMESAGIETMLQFMRIQKPKKILEIGTAIGYSAIRIAQAISGSEIVTIERDETRYNQAIHFIRRAGLENRISVILGDALEVAAEAGEMGPYDAIFIDAAKGQYQKFFEMYTPYLAENGVVYTDNVLFKGHVAETEIAKKRIRQLASKIRQYNQWLVNHSSFSTMIIPVGDGLAISIYRGEKDGK
ncbi:O-methyltransferase [Bacillus smithii]|uniref:O-methyltransferase n=1 Tax=Bacillus smithii TaxID=1479 RepID=UPI0030C94560